MFEDEKQLHSFVKKRKEGKGGRQVGGLLLLRREIGPGGLGVRKGAPASMGLTPKNTKGVPSPPAQSLGLHHLSHLPDASF